MSTINIHVDDKMEVEEMDSPKGRYPYLKTAESLGSMAMVLPYRKRMGNVQYLLRRELIPCWDSHTDICGIAVHGAIGKLEKLLKETLLKETGYNIRLTELKGLGVCACDRHTDTSCYLYAVDLSRHNPEEEKLEIDEEMSFWANADEILESLDSQLISCYAKVQYLLI